MFIEKILLNGFGGFTEKEINIVSPFTVLVGHDPAELKTIKTAISLILFGISPDKRLELRNYIYDRKKCSAALRLKAENGKKYLIGRDFIEERVEIFEETGIRLLPQSSTVLMNLLRTELGTLNPLDFEAIYLLDQDEMEVNQNSLGIREELQKVLKAYQDGIKENLSYKLEAAVTADFSEPVTIDQAEIQEEINQIQNHLRKLEGKLEEYQEAEQKVAAYKNYEAFISPDNKNQIEVLSQQLTALALERKYVEEQVRAAIKMQTTLEQEKKKLQAKVGLFEELFSPEKQRFIEKLIKERDEKNEVLKGLESEYSYGGGKKRLLSRKDKEQEKAEEKMNKLLKELSEMRSRIEEDLHGRSIEQFLKEKKEYEENKENLIRLQQSPASIEGIKKEEELEQLRNEEKETRRRLDELLVKAGSTDLKDLKKRVNTLATVREEAQRMKQEIDFLSGDYEPIEAIRIMRKKIDQLHQSLESGEKAETMAASAKERDELVKDPLHRFYVEGSEIIKRVTGGKIREFAPEFIDGKYKFKVLYENAWCDLELISPRQKRVFLLILRMLLARLHAPVVRFPYIINNVVGGLDLEESAEKVELFLIINELLAGAQVIYLADEGERRIIEENQAINKEIIKI